jgi:hypothetical protein
MLIAMSLVGALLPGKLVENGPLTLGPPEEMDVRGKFTIPWTA